MGKRSMLIIGSVIILLGLIELMGVIFNINIGKLCFPVALILFGLFLIFRPRIFPRAPELKLKLFPNIHRHGDWQVQHEEIMMFVGDIDLDISQAELKPGDTTWRIFGFVGDIDVRATAGVGLKLISTAFLSTSRCWGTKSDHFLTQSEHTSPNFDQMDKRFILETYFFVADVRFDQDNTSDSVE